MTSDLHIEKSENPDVWVLVDLVRWLDATEQLDEYIMQQLLDYARMRGLDLQAALNA